MQHLQPPVRTYSDIDDPSRRRARARRMRRRGPPHAGRRRSTLDSPTGSLRTARRSSSRGSVGRSMRTSRANGIDRQAKARLQHHEHGAGGPRLRQARDRIRDRRLAGTARKAAMELGHAHAEVRGRTEHLVEPVRGAFLVAVARESCGADRGIVRPHRPVVIRHRVEVRLVATQRSDAEARVERRCAEALHHFRRALGSGQSRVKKMPRVRCANAAERVAARRARCRRTPWSSIQNCVFDLAANVFRARRSNAARLAHRRAYVASDAMALHAACTYPWTSTSAIGLMAIEPSA